MHREQHGHGGNTMPAFLLAGRYEYLSAAQDIRIVIDTAEIEFYIDICPFADPDHVEQYLDATVFGIGFEFAEEVEPDTTEEGWTRMYLVPMEPVDDMTADESLKVPKSLRLVGFGASAASLLSGLGAAVFFATHAVVNHPLTSVAMEAMSS